MCKSGVVQAPVVRARERAEDIGGGRGRCGQERCVVIERDDRERGSHHAGVAMTDNRVSIVVVRLEVVKTPVVRVRAYILFRYHNMQGTMVQLDTSDMIPPPSPVRLQVMSLLFLHDSSFTFSILLLLHCPWLCINAKKQTR